MTLLEKARKQQKLKFMPFWEQMGMQAASGAIQGGMGLLFGGIDRQSQYNQQKKLQALQIKGQKEMSEYNRQLSMKMWEDTNYGPQVEQMKKAGINPALLYAKGGAGGMLANPSGSVSGGIASEGQATKSMNAGMAMNIAQMDAQRKLTEAQTKNVEADTAKKTGVDTENVAQTTDNLRQDYELKKLDIAMKNIENYEKQATQEDRMEYIEFQTGKAMRELETATAEGKIATETVQAKIKTIREKAIGAVLENALTQAQTGNTKQSTVESKAKVQQIAANIAQGWESLNQGDRKIKIEGFKAEINAAFPGLGETFGRLINEGLEGILRNTTGREVPYKIQK